MSHASAFLRLRRLLRLVPDGALAALDHRHRMNDMGAAQRLLPITVKGERTMASGRQTLVKVIQDSIDKGATTVEEIHKAIGDLPLKILEGSEQLKGPAKEVRHLRDHTIGAMYDLIRKINEEVGTLASERLAEAAKRRTARREAHHAARRAGVTPIRRNSGTVKARRRQGAKQRAVKRA